MYRITALTLCIVMVLSVSVLAIELDDFSVSVTLYPQKMPNKIENSLFINDQEWLSFSVDFTISIYQGFYTRFDTQTFIFATSGFRSAPSSVKFISEIGYEFDHLSVKYRHFCHHYFHQFENQYNDSDKLVFEYSF